MNKRINAILLAAVVILSACSSKSEKDLAKDAAPAANPETVVTDYCGGKMAATVPLVDACNKEHATFGKEFNDGANCAALRQVFKNIEAMNAEKPGSCRPRIRF